MKRILILIALMFFLSSFAAFSGDRLPPERGAFSLKLGVFSPSGDGNFWQETEEVFLFEVEDLKV